eukprot:4706565-Pyramimonas_sp.AAC.1
MTRICIYYVHIRHDDGHSNCAAGVLNGLEEDGADQKAQGDDEEDSTRLTPRIQGSSSTRVGVREGETVSLLALSN